MKIPTILLLPQIAALPVSNKAEKYLQFSGDGTSFPDVADGTVVALDQDEGKNRNNNVPKCHKFADDHIEQCIYESSLLCDYDFKEKKCKAVCHKFSGLANMQSACDQQEGCYFKGKQNLCIPKCETFTNDREACNWQKHCDYDFGTCKKVKKKSSFFEPKFPDCKHFRRNWSQCTLMSEACRYDSSDDTCKANCQLLTKHGESACNRQWGYCFWDSSVDQCLADCGTFDDKKACRRQPQCKWSSWCVRDAFNSKRRDANKKDVTVCHKDYSNYWECQADSQCYYNWSDRTCRPHCDQRHGQQSACDKQKPYCYFKGGYKNREKLCLPMCDTFKTAKHCDNEFHCSWTAGACAKDKTKAAKRWVPADRVDRGDAGEPFTVCESKYANSISQCNSDRQCEWFSTGWFTGKCRAKCEQFVLLGRACGQQSNCHYNGYQCLWNCDTFSWLSCSMSTSAYHCKWDSGKGKCARAH